MGEEIEDSMDQRSGRTPIMNPWATRDDPWVIFLPKGDGGLAGALETQSKLWFVFGVSRSIRKYRFAATDADWSVGPAEGPVIAATGEELLQVATGRRPLPARG